MDSPEHAPTEEALKESQELQQLLMQLALDCIRLPLEKVDSAINDILRAVGEFLNADRVYVFRHDYTRQVTTNTHEWCAEGITSEIDNLQAIPFKFITDILETHQREDAVQIPRKAGRAEEHPALSVFVAQDIRSMLLLPLSHEGKILGFVGFDMVRQDKIFFRNEISLLQVLAELIAYIQERQKFEKSLEESQARDRAMLSAVQDLMFVFDLQGTYLDYHCSNKKLLAIEPEQFLGKSVHEVLPAEIAGRFLQCLRRAMETNQLQVMDYALYVPAGYKHFQARITPMDEQRLLSIVQDITDHKKAEEALRESQERLQTVLENLPGGIFIHDLDGRFLLVNKAACQNTGYSRQELLQMAVHEIDAQALARQDRSKFWNNIDSNQPIMFESTHLRKDGSQYPVEIHLTQIAMDRQPVILAIAFDITKRKHMEQKLKEMSLYDSLTGIYNRAFYEEEFRRLADNRYSPLGIIICDINGLKLINDTLGHAKGDELLKTAANILKSCLRAGEIVARIGGDEFAVLLPQSSEEIVSSCAARIRQEVARYNELNKELGISLALGYAVQEGPLADTKDLFKRADEAMYREKLQQSCNTSSGTVQTLIKALEARDFQIQCQAGGLYEYVWKLGKALDFFEEELKELQLLARFRDLGQVGVSEEILSKPGPLNEQELREMQRHCEIGQRIALSLADLAPVADYILKHHEWWNGQGYPIGLQGQEIPLMCRILAISAAYEAMTCERPYRKALSHEQAIQELQRCAGTQFDPHLVQVFLDIVQAPQQGQL